MLLSLSLSLSLSVSLSLHPTTGKEKEGSMCCKNWITFSGRLAVLFIHCPCRHFGLAPPRLSSCLNPCPHRYPNLHLTAVLLAMATDMADLASALNKMEVSKKTEEEKPSPPSEQPEQQKKPEESPPASSDKPAEKESPPP